MFVLFDEQKKAEVYYDSFESEAVKRAVKDLETDLGRIRLSDACVKANSYLPRRSDGYLVIGTITNSRYRSFAEEQGIDLASIDGKWEVYRMQTFGERNQNLLICGSDDRGTMWGIYDLCRQELGVDPLYYWTDQSPEKRAALRVAPVCIDSKPPEFPYRGWFLNDEDLLTEWKAGGGARIFDYPFYHHVLHPDLMDKVIETALRLKQNVLIPASFIDIMNPAEESLVKSVTDRGLFISQHHVEPLGVSHFAWDIYWQERGEEIPASYVTHPEKFEQIWTDYARRWALYPNVIWQLGLRGRADRPVWESDLAVPDTIEARGKLISSAIRKQWDIVQQALGHLGFVATVTLWSEGMELYNKGALNFPENAMIIFADTGNSQMLGDDYYSVNRERARKCGIYYHVAFWSCGPHLAQGTSIDKIHYNYSNLVANGDTCYSILNVSNIREFVLGIRAVADMTWSFDEFEKESFMRDWIAEQFGAGQTEEIAELYQRFYAAYQSVSNNRLSGELVLLDGVTKVLGYIMMSEPYLQGKYEEAYPEWSPVTPDLVRNGIESWKDVYNLACELEAVIDERRKGFFVSHLLVQIEVMIGLYSWLYPLLLIREEWRGGMDRTRCRTLLNESVYHLQKLTIDRRKAASGHWTNWYKGDTKFDISDMLKKTKMLFREFQL